MSSAILSAFPRPPNHIPSSPLPGSPLPPTPGLNGPETRPVTPSASGRRTPVNGSQDPDFQSKKEKRRSRGSSFGSRMHGSSAVGSEPLPRMSVESSIAFANADGLDASTVASPLESTFSHTTAITHVGAGPNNARVSHYENLRRSLLNDANSSRGSYYGDRNSHYSQGTAEGSSGSSSHGNLYPQAHSSSSSRPSSFMGPGSPPLNVPLSASARLAALRAKRAGLGALSITTPPPGTGNDTLRAPGTAQLAPGSTGSHGWANMPAAGPPPMVPLPPIPNSHDNAVDLKGKRRSVNLASPVRSTFTYSAADSTAASTPTTTVFSSAPSAFHRSNPSGATFGVARSVSGRSGGDHSRASSLGSATEASFRPSVPALPGAFAGYKLAAGNASTSTFGGIGDGKNGSSSSLGEDPVPSLSFKNKARMHKPTFSTSTVDSDGTAYGNDKRFTTMSTDGFAGGLAALSASINSSTPSSGTDSSPSSNRITDARSTSSSAANIAAHRSFPTVAIEDEEPFDIQAELEKIKKDRERREKMDRRVSSSSMMSNFSTRTNNTFRGAGSRVMDVSPEEVQNDDAAEMAGERLLDSLGDDLEGLGVWNGGKKSHVSRSLALGKRTGSSSRPGSSKGPGSMINGSSGLSSAANSRPTSMIGAPKKINFPSLSPDLSPHGPTPDVVVEAEDADQTITLPKTGIYGTSSLSKAQTSSSARESIFSLYTRRDSDQTFETFEEGVIGSSSNFANRLSTEMESRASSGSSISQQLSMKEPTRRLGSNGKIPDLRVEEAVNPHGRTPMASRTPLSDRSNEDKNLVDIRVWNEAPMTPRSADSTQWHSSQANGGSSLTSKEATGTITSPHKETTHSGHVPPSTSALQQHPSDSTPQSKTIPLTSDHLSTSNKQSLDIDRPNSAMSTGSRRRIVAPPALSLSRATPLSSETSLVLPDDEDDAPDSPSAGRNRANGGGHKARGPSEDFAIKLEQDLEAEGMRGEFALLQEVSVREKRVKLALFGRGNLPKPGSMRPHSLAVVEKSLPDSPERESADGRDDGASSPDINEMIRRGRKSLGKAQKRAMRRRRSTGALQHYASMEDWTRSGMDRSLGITSKGPNVEDGSEGDRRRAMELDRSGVRVRDSVVLELPPEQIPGRLHGEPEEAGSDSDIDLHTPLPHLMLQAGLLSPHSKVLRPPSPEMSSRDSLSSKHGLKVPVDKRNTDKRKRRHRDGKLLREGVGLTTGLGWSDSEDEDAPSPLTRRLSSMTLTSTISRKASLASSINSFAGGPYTSMHLSRSPSMPSIPDGAAISNVSLVSRKSSSSGSDITSRHPENKIVVAQPRSSYGQSTPRPPTKQTGTMSIIEHAQMLPTASLLNSKTHPFATVSRRPAFNFSIENRRSSSPAGNSSQSSNGGAILPVTPDTDISSSVGVGGSLSMLKDVSLSDDLQGVSGSSLGQASISFSGPGAGLAGIARGRSWTGPPSPTPAVTAILPDGEEAMPTRQKAKEARYSGGNFSYPTAMRHVPDSSLSAIPASPNSDRFSEEPPKPAPRGLQPLMLPPVVAAGGRLSPRAGGTFALPSSPTLNGVGAVTPKRSGLPLPGSNLSKSTSNIPSNSPAVNSSRSRSGSTGNSQAPSAAQPANADPKPTSRMPQPSRNRTLSGGGNSVIPPVPAPAVPTTPTAKGFGSMRSLVSARSPQAPATILKKPGIMRATSAPGSPPTRIGTPSGVAKIGAGMAYRKSAGSAAEASVTPMKSRLAPPTASASRLATPGLYSLKKNASTSSLNSSAVGVAI
ncbi:hypothetical protein CPB86DRAFT_776700 [Serendipita vermifera]|nr:hypothetical protein CPB86DRAFT_776700 [Serendipita vermifera]